MQDVGKNSGHNVGAEEQRVVPEELVGQQAAVERSGSGCRAERLLAVRKRLRDVERLVRIPSVSADPAAAPHLAASAREVAALLRAAGLHDAEVVSAGDGRPAVLGHRPGPPGAPTVRLYAYHDLHPPADAAAWDCDPFEPAERGGRLRVSVLVSVRFFIAVPGVMVVVAGTKPAERRLPR
jgi:hypothetical protein